MDRLSGNYGFQTTRQEPSDPRLSLKQNGYHSSQLSSGSERSENKQSYSDMKRSTYGSPSPRRWSPSPRRRRTPSPRRRRTPSPRQRTPSPKRRRSPSPKRRRSPSPKHDRERDSRKRSRSPPRSFEKSKRTKIDFAQYEEIPVETSGRSVPAPIKSFDDIDLGKRIRENIRAVGYEAPTPVQKYSLPIVMNNRDLMACAQTGSGKTAAFLLPILSTLCNSPPPPRSLKAYPLALVMAPTRELACQIQAECTKFAAKTGIRSAVVYGGTSISYQLQTLEMGCDVLVATPGRLVDIMDRGRVSLSRIQFLVLDEADRMLDMGFEPQIRKIVEKTDMPRKGTRRTLMFSATFPKPIQQLASSFLEDYVFLAVGRVGSTTELVTQKFLQVEGTDKSQVLLDLLNSRDSKGLSLIFVEKKKSAESLARFLMGKRVPATSIHGDRSQKERTAAIRSFSRGETPVLVATNVAARGLDIDDIDHVINYDMPADIDDYVHRIGRTGRAGKAGLSTTFITRQNANIVDKLIELLQESNQEIPDWLYDMRGHHSGNSKFRQFRGSGGPRYGGKDFRLERPPPPPLPSFGQVYHSQQSSHVPHHFGTAMVNAQPMPPPPPISHYGAGAGYPPSYPSLPWGYPPPPPPSHPKPY